MRRWLRIIPVALMGVFAIAYVVLRPTLTARAPYVTILEFPLGALVIGLALWAALATRRPAPEPRWHRHAQVVRVLPDPALVAYEAPIERWLETGEGHDEAADVVARAVTPDKAEQDHLRARLIAVMQIKASRRKRESLIKEHIEGV